MQSMTFPRFRIYLTAALTLTLCNITSAADISAELEANIAERIESKVFPGLIIGITDVNGHRYYGFGETTLGEGKLPDKDTIYEIGSITKTFTATLLADMVQNGELDLGDTAQSRLPASVTLPQRAGQEITLETLSTHRSALPRMPENFAPANQLNPYIDYSVENMYEFLSAYELPRDIGETGEYSNLAVGLLGHILSLRVNSSYEELLTARILTPLAMNNTAITFSETMQQHLAPPYTAANGFLFQVQNWDLDALAGAGAIRSNAEDMLTYIDAQIGLVDSPLAAAMALTHEAREEFGNGDEIGLGWIISPLGGGKIHWHNGGTGGYRTMAGFSLTAQRGVLVMTNSTNGTDDIGRYLMDASLPLMSAPKTRIAISLAEEELVRFTGRYRLSPDVVAEMTSEAGHLYTQLTGQPRFELFPESATEFFLKVVDAQIVFELDESGAPQDAMLFQGGQEIPLEKIE